MIFDTPFGPTAPFTHAKYRGKELLYVDFHGIAREIRNTQPDSSGERVFYVLWRAGVKKILGTALCGSTNRLLDPGDAVIPDDFVGFTTKRAQMLMVSSRIRAWTSSGTTTGSTNPCARPSAGTSSRRAPRPGSPGSSGEASWASPRGSALRAPPR